MWPFNWNRDSSANTLTMDRSTTTPCFTEPVTKLYPHNKYTTPFYRISFFIWFSTYAPLFFIFTNNLFWLDATYETGIFWSLCLFRLHEKAFSILLCTFGRVANIFEFFQCVLLVDVKVSTLKGHFVSLSAHCGNAENTFQHLWTRIFQRILRQPNFRPLLAFSA